jgi:hypothetical protein
MRLLSMLSLRVVSYSASSVAVLKLAGPPERVAQVRRQRCQTLPVLPEETVGLTRQHWLMGEDESGRLAWSSRFDISE